VEFSHEKKRAKKCTTRRAAKLCEPRAGVRKWHFTFRIYSTRARNRASNGMILAANTHRCGTSRVEVSGETRGGLARM